MKYKKIYIEITNICNLSCSFCALNNREKKYMSINEFKIILDKIKPYTKYIYLHVMGEALIHPNILEIIEISVKNGFYVQITTNGYLINKLYNIIGIRQLNISLQAFNDKNNKSLEDYMKDIFIIVDNLRNNGTIINYRMWVDSEYSSSIIKYLEKQYSIKINDNITKLSNQIYYSKEQEFIWPSRVEEGEFIGYCPALKDQIGILVDGNVVPCCLDNNGLIYLGNLFNEDLEDIINSSKYQNMLNNFQNNKKVEDLCRKCNFYQNR